MTRPLDRHQGSATLALHAGEDQRVTGEPVAIPPVLSTSFHTEPDAVGFPTGSFYAGSKR